MKERSKNPKTIVVGLQNVSQNNDHIYFNDEWNDEYED